MSEHSSSEQYTGVNIRDAKAAFDDVARALVLERHRYKPGKEGWYESSTDALTHENGDRTSLRAKVLVDQDLLTASHVVLFDQYERQISTMDNGSRYILSESIAEHADEYDWMLLTRLVTDGAANVRVQTLTQVSYEFAPNELPTKRMTGSVSILSAKGRKYILDDPVVPHPHRDEVLEQTRRDISSLVPEDLVTIRSVLSLF